MKLTDRNSLNFWQDKVAKIVAAHLLDQMDSIIQGADVGLTPFLTRAMRDWSEGLLAKHRLNYLFHGGFSDAEKLRLVISAHESLSLEDAKVGILKVTTLDPKAVLEHRQILGSLMGLGLKRESLGDIRAGQGAMFVAVTAEIIPFLLQEWDKAGSHRIQAEIITDPSDLPSDPGEERRITAASVRLDAVIAGAFNISRTVAQQLVNQGKVKQNDLVVTKSDLEVQFDSIISCRGYGRLCLKENQGSTRKGRLGLRLVVWQSRRH